jgi:hypothetical protein
MGLKINEFKSKEMKVNPSTDLALTVNCREVEPVKFLTYLGSIITIDGGALEDFHSRIKKANGAFMQLYPVWRNKNILVRTKIRLVNTDVTSVLLYGVKHGKQLNG